MKNLLLLIGLTFCSLQFTFAQETAAPLKDAVENEVRPEAPSDNHTWVKGHWHYSAGKYFWIDGAYIENVENHAWVDGRWVRNQSNDTWTFQNGFWDLVNESIVYNGITYNLATNNPESSVIHMIQPEQNLSLN